MRMATNRQKHHLPNRLFSTLLPRLIFLGLRNPISFAHCLAISAERWAVQLNSATPLFLPAMTLHPVGYEIFFENLTAITTEWVPIQYSTYYSSNRLFHFSIVFVHGLCGHRTETWTKGNICWPRDLLPNEGALSSTRILSFGYDSTVIDPSGHALLNNLFDHSISLLHGLCQVRKQNAVSWGNFLRHSFNKLHSAL